MTKRLLLWNQELSSESRGTAQPEPKGPVPDDPQATTDAHDPPEPEPGVPLEAGSWEALAPEPLERESLPDRRSGKKPRRVPRHKTRRHSVSVAVSEEEERMLRTYAAGLNKSFSEWSRSVLFRAMGRRVPARSGPEES